MIEFRPGVFATRGEVTTIKLRRYRFNGKEWHADFTCGVDTIKMDIPAELRNKPLTPDRPRAPRGGLPI